MNKAQEAQWLELEKGLRAAERTFENLSEEERRETAEKLLEAAGALGESLERDLSKLPEKVLFSAKGEAMEEALAILEDARDMMDEALRLLKEGPGADAEEAAAILGEAADSLGDVVRL